MHKCIGCWEHGHAPQPVKALRLSPVDTSLSAGGTAGGAGMSCRPRRGSSSFQNRSSSSAAQGSKGSGGCSRWRHVSWVQTHPFAVRSPQAACMATACSCTLGRPPSHPPAEQQQSGSTRPLTSRHLEKRVLVCMQRPRHGSPVINPIQRRRRRRRHQRQVGRRLRECEQRRRGRSQHARWASPHRIQLLLRLPVHVQQPRRPIPHVDGRQYVGQLLQHFMPPRHNRDGKHQLVGLRLSAGRLLLRWGRLRRSSCRRHWLVGLHLCAGGLLLHRGRLQGRSSCSARWPVGRQSRHGTCHRRGRGRSPRTTALWSRRVGAGLLRGRARDLGPFVRVDSSCSQLSSYAARERGNMAVKSRVGCHGGLLRCEGWLDSSELPARLPGTAPAGTPTHAWPATPCRSAACNGTRSPAATREGRLGGEDAQGTRRSSCCWPSCRVQTRGPTYPTTLTSSLRHCRQKRSALPLASNTVSALVCSAAGGGGKTGCQVSRQMWREAGHAATAHSQATANASWSGRRMPGLDCMLLLLKVPGAYGRA